MTTWYCENCKAEIKQYLKTSVIWSKKNDTFMECSDCGHYYIPSNEEIKDVQMDDTTRKVKGSRAKKLSPGGIFFAHEE